MIPQTRMPATATLEARRSFALHEPDLVWVVMAGTLDVFATRCVDGLPDGALRPLLTVSAGKAVFGLPNDHSAGVMLVARQGPESQVAVRPVASLATGVPAPKGEAVDEWLEYWVGSLWRLIGGAPLPRDASMLESGAHVTVPEEATPLGTAGRLLWIWHLAGSSRVLGRADLVVDESVPYPLSRVGWIAPQPHAELSGHAADDLFLDEVHLRGLHAFQRHVLLCVARQIDEADESVRARLRARADADARTLEVAVRDLASPLTAAGSAVPVAAPGTFDTPLMRACRVIGDVLGVTMKPHPDLVRGIQVRNPVTAIARASGVRYRRVALKDEWWRESSEPLLAFRDADQSPLALIPRRSRGGYMMVDPDNATPRKLDRTLAAALNPFAYMFYRPFPEKALSIRDLLAFGVRNSRHEVLTIVMLTAGIGVVGIALPVLTGVIFDSLIPNARRSDLVTVAALIIVAAVASAGLTLTRGFAVLRLQGRMAATLQAGLWDRLLSLPVPFFRDYSAGDLASRSIAISQIRTMLTASTLGAILTGASSIFSFGLLFYYSPSLALLATGLTAVAAAVTITSGVFEVRLQRQIFERGGLIAGLVLELITGITKFRIAGVERRAFALWVRQFAAQKRTDFAARRLSNRLVVFNSVYVVTCLAVLFYAHSRIQATSEQPLTTGQFLAFVAAFTQFIGAALALSSAVVGALNVVPLYERAAPILGALPEVTTAQASPGELAGEVEAHHVAFRYDADAPLVLRDISFSIRPREYVAFVGPSGCGKSTLFRLFLGFERPVAGSIYYDGKELSGLDIEAVRQQIGVVLQTGTLLGGSIKDNICGAAAIPMDAVMEAVRLAGLEEDIARMPMGLHTMLFGPNGGLSGGQRQRVLIARAIVLKPRILLFDEATSALDNRTQAIVSNSLKTLNATRVVIAHRLSTILEADRIHVMDQGRIVQAGTFAQLMRQRGLFRILAERQLT